MKITVTSNPQKLQFYQLKGEHFLGKRVEIFLMLSLFPHNNFP